MSETTQSSSPEQAHELYEIVSEISVTKGMSFVDTPATFRWHGATVHLPETIRLRAKSSLEDAENFHAQTSKGNVVTAPGSLALIRFIAPSGFSSGDEMVEYRIIGEQDEPADIECHTLKSLLPRIPDEVNMPPDPSMPTLDLNDVFTSHPYIALDLLITHIQERNRIAEATHSQMKTRQRELGHFVTSYSEASELIVLAEQLLVT